MATAVAREAVFALRREIARIEGRLPDRLDAAGERPFSPGANSGLPSEDLVLRRHGMPGEGLVLPIGNERLDTALGGGLPFAALTEIHGAQTRDAGAVAGFTLALAAMALRQSAVKAPLLWVAAGEVLSEAGLPYAPGILHRFGIPTDALLVAETRRLEDALWVAEEAAALTALSSVILEVRGHSRRLDLTATRRLHRRAQAAARPLYLLRQAGEPEPTAAPVRLVVSPAPAAERRTILGALEGSIGPPAFTVTIARSRMAIPATVILEWNKDECAFHERRIDGSADAGAQDPGAVVSAAPDRADSEKQAGAVVAFRGAA